MYPRFVPFLLTALVTAQQAHAQDNSTVKPVLEGWQPNDNTRSTWDILWTCLATTFACTWTLLHLNVPKHNASETIIFLKKLAVLFVAVLAPELLAWIAVFELAQARITATRCNTAERRAYSEEGGLKASLHRRAWPLEAGQASAHGDLYPDQTEWTLAHGFCINMKGLALKTQDGWLFRVRSKNVEALIAAGLVKSADIRDREIKDRTKADSFAKAFSVLQSVWTMCNIAARAAYQLPITPLEIATIAYVACAIFIYAMWWYKPKDMMTPIIVSLPYVRDSVDVPQEVWSVMNSSQGDWVHSRVIPLKFSKALQSNNIQSEGASTNTNDPRRGLQGPGMTFAMEWALDHIVILIAELYCCIHLAAWNHTFPTEVEKSAWRVLSLIMIIIPMIIFAILQGPMYMTWLSSKINIPWLQNYISPESKFTNLETFIMGVCYVAYLIGRLGVVILTFSSLRALPAGSYVIPSWLAAIPHV